MSAWRIDQIYGFGAASVRLCPDPVGSGRARPGLGPALGGLAADLRARGFFASLGSGLRLLPGVALALVLALALIETLGRECVDTPDLQVVRFEPAPEPVLPPPEPVPQEELPPPPPPVVAKIEPPQPQPRLEPPPAPPPPARPAPRPAPPTMAHALVPPPLPVAERPHPVRRAPAPAPTPAPAAARPRPDVRIDALAQAPARPTPPLPAARAPSPGAEPEPRRPAFQLAMPASPLPAARPAAPASRTAARPALPRPEPGTRAARPGDLAVAPLAAADPAPARASADPAPTRVAREAPPAAPHTHGAEPQLRGVPLGSLAACVSDRREDELKLRVMAERGDVGECASAAGHYRFVETRNLNAFLMWVERAPTRRAADRCAELSLALECLAQQRGRSRQT